MIQAPMMKYCALLLLAQISAVPQYGVVTGTVVDARGVLVDEATIHIVKDDEPDMNAYLTTLSDTKGSFTLGNVESGRYRIYVWKRDAGVPVTRFLIFSPDGPENKINVTPNATQTPITLTLPKPFATIQGQVTDAQTSAPIVHARLQLKLAVDEHIDYQTSAGNNGEFLLYVPPKEVKLVISAPGYSPWTYTSRGGNQVLRLGDSDHLTWSIQLRQARH